MTSVCQHRRQTIQGSDQWQGRVVCLDCKKLLFIAYPQAQMDLVTLHGYRWIGNYNNTSAPVTSHPLYTELDRHRLAEEATSCENGDTPTKNTASGNQTVQSSEGNNQGQRKTLRQSMGEVGLQSCPKDGTIA